MVANKVVGHFIYKNGYCGRERDDLLSDAYLGIAQALPRFEADMGVPIENYVWQRAYGSVLDGTRRESHIPRSAYARGERIADVFGTVRAPMSLSVFDDGEDDEAWEMDPGMKGVEDENEIEILLAVLDQRDRFVVTEILLKDRMAKDVAAEMGVTEGRVSQLRKRALKAMRDAAEPVMA